MVSHIAATSGRDAPVLAVFPTHAGTAAVSEGSRFTRWRLDRNIAECGLIASVNLFVNVRNVPPRAFTAEGWPTVVVAVDVLVSAVDGWRCSISPMTVSDHATVDFALLHPAAKAFQQFVARRGAVCPGAR